MDETPHGQVHFPSQRIGLPKKHESQPHAFVLLEELELTGGTLPHHASMDVTMSGQSEGSYALVVGFQHESSENTFPVNASVPHIFAAQLPMRQNAGVPMTSTMQPLFGSAGFPPPQSHCSLNPPIPPASMTPSPQ